MVKMNFETNFEKRKENLSLLEEISERLLNQFLAFMTGSLFVYYYFKGNNFLSLFFFIVALFPLFTPIKLAIKTFKY